MTRPFPSCGARTGCDVFHADAARVAEVRAAQPDAITVERLAEIFKALGRSHPRQTAERAGDRGALRVRSRHAPRRCRNRPSRINFVSSAASASFARAVTAAWSSTASTTTTSSGCWRRGASTRRKARRASRAERWRAPRRVSRVRRVRCMPSRRFASRAWTAMRKWRSSSAGLKHLGRPRIALGGCRRRPAARAVRRGAPVHRDDLGRGRRHRHARVARARGGAPREHRPIAVRPARRVGRRAGCQPGRCGARLDVGRAHRVRDRDRDRAASTRPVEP